MGEEDGGKGRRRRQPLRSRIQRRAPSWDVQARGRFRHISRRATAGGRGPQVGDGARRLVIARGGRPTHQATAGGVPRQPAVHRPPWPFVSSSSGGRAIRPRKCAPQRPYFAARPPDHLRKKSGWHAGGKGSARGVSEGEQRKSARGERDGGFFVDLQRQHLRPRSPPSRALELVTVQLPMATKFFWCRRSRLRQGREAASTVRASGSGPAGRGRCG